MSAFRCCDIPAYNTSGVRAAKSGNRCWNAETASERAASCCCDCCGYSLADSSQCGESRPDPIQPGV
ncbi:hypothetical protein BKA81DRAFT_12046 [Phyllosticta paracitricarpa]